ncbi:hypothetical protein AB0F81_09610 [Actinoplanes sp. NPDC024001]|uniref:hypothetical protein n=1 Tax=Actinoplanes sp. NPDC024001 TaxID=3154598 RepID=UPI0033DAA3EB
MRAATSLVALFHQWTLAITEGVVVHDEGGWLRIEEDELPWVNGLDLVAFPVDLEEHVLRQRQTECGVDLAAVDEGFDRREKLIHAVAAVKAALKK